MRGLRVWLHRLLGSLGRDRRERERELDEELRSHLEMLVDDQLRSGLSPAEARKKACITLGGVEELKEQCRDALGLRVIDQLGRDLQFALRGIRRTPLFSAVVVLSLGIAIGSNTAILNLAHALFTRPLPIEDPGRVVALYSTQPDLGVGTPLSFLNWLDLRQQSQTLEPVAGYEWESLAVETPRGTSRVPAQLVSGNYFQTLGVSPARGPSFSPAADNVLGAPLEVVISHHFWQNYLEGDPAAVGRALRINGQPFTIVGVTGPAFTGLNVGLQVELWIPFGVYRQIYPESAWGWYESRRGVIVYGIGRLRAGAQMSQVRAELSSIGRRLERDHPEFNENRGVQALPIAEATIFPWARPFVRNGVVLLAAAVALTLLIAATNVANLLLLRTRERRREVAIRLALGVSRGGLATRLFVECIVLSGLGGCTGIGFVWLTQQALSRVIAYIPSPTAGPYQLPVELDPLVFAVAFALSVLMGLVLGLFPVLTALQGDSSDALRARSDLGGGEARRFGLRNVLLVTQLALSFVALLGGALFLRSLSEIRELDPGFERQQLAFLRVDLSTTGTPSNARTPVRERLVRSLSALPGVERVGVSPREPMDGGWSRPMAPSESAADPDARISPYTDRVDAAFFDAMGLAFVEGRAFTLDELRQPPRVAILNQELSQRLWPGQSALGRSLVLFDLEGRASLEIVGVVESAKYRRLTETNEGYVYMPLSDDYEGLLTFAIRTSGEPDSVLSAAVSETRRLEPGLPIVSAQTVSQVLNRSLWGPRLAAAFLGLFATIALILSAVGIYGVISYDVTRRTRELCIRVAMGAERFDIAGLVLLDSGRHYLIGVVAGVPVAYAASRWVSGLIFVDLLDPYAIVGSVLPLGIVGALAAWIPVRRATSLDPNEVLRTE